MRFFRRKHRCRWCGEEIVPEQEHYKTPAGEEFGVIHATGYYSCEEGLTVAESR